MKDFLNDECLAVKVICEKFGYGNVMEWASALWRYNFKQKGYPISACFVPTCPDFIKEEFKCDATRKNYDNFVEEILKGNKDG